MNDAEELVALAAHVEAAVAPFSNASRLTALEAQVEALTAKCAALEASLLEVRASVRASNMQRPRALRE